MEEYFNVVMELLKITDATIQKEEYWFFRADVNVIMAWLRVLVFGISVSMLLS